MIVTIDTDKIKVAVDEAGNFYFKPGAEKHLKLLVQYQAELAEAMALAQANLQAVINDNNPAVTSIVGNKIKITRSLTGSVYAPKDGVEIANIAEDFVSKSVTLRLNSKAIEAYAEANGELPADVVPANRKYRMAIKVVE